MKKYLMFQQEIEYDKLREISKEINDGKIAIFPTETVYGIGTNCFQIKAIEKIYELKKRPMSKAISVLISNLSMVDEIAEKISEEERKVMEAFFPGPLTLVVKKSSKISDIVTAGMDTVGIRMPENEIALKLIEEVGYPLATSSANLAGKESYVECTGEMIEEFKEGVDFFIDGGKCELEVASTVARIEDGNVFIYREGLITKEAIENILRKMK